MIGVLIFERIASLSSGQFFCPLRGAHDSFDERHAQAAFFELQNAVDGATSGCGHGIFQQRRMIAGVEHHLGRAKGGLRRQQGRCIARQADLTPASASDSRMM